VRLIPAPVAALPRDVRVLMAARAARSLGQGAMMAAFALYLHALGFTGSAIGAVLAAGLHLVLHGTSLMTVDRALFALPLAGAVVSFVLVFGTEDPDLAPPAASAAEQTARRRRENRNLGVLAFANGLNGFGIGMVGPLMAYWFARRYGHSLVSIGPAIAASFVLGALGSVLAAHMAPRYGVVGAVWRMRLVGLVLLALTPLSPAFGLAAASYALRAAFNQGTAGVRQALAAGLTDARRRGLASTLNNPSLQIPRAAGPLLAGALLHRGHLELPFFIAAAFQLAYLIVYTRAFRDQDASPPDAD
jgi:Major Facilitator Superfamily